MKSSIPVVLSLWMLGSSLGAFADSPAPRPHISKEDERKVLTEAKKRSRSLYYVIARALKNQLSVKGRLASECSIDDSVNGHVSCAVTDVSEDHGWTEGLSFSWVVTHDEQDDTHRYRFENSEYIAH